MKRLTLLRHAKSERDSPTGKDFDRSLNERGRRDAKRMGKEIRHLGLRFDGVLSSPAARAVETAERAGFSPRLDERIYDASRAQLVDVVQSVDDEAESLLMIGHNPGFEQLAASLTDGAVDDFPTAALVEIELPFNHWRKVKPGSGQLARFIKPKELA